MKKTLLISFFLIITAIFCSAQSSERLGKMIESKQITKQQASYLIAVYLNLVPEDCSDEQAFDALVAQKYFTPTGPLIDCAKELIDLKQASYICAKAVNLKGGIFYSLTKSKRYAYKELKALGILTQESDPDMKVSGANFISMFNDCIEKAEGQN